MCSDRSGIGVPGAPSAFCLTLPLSPTAGSSRLLLGEPWHTPPAFCLSLSSLLQFPGTLGDGTPRARDDVFLAVALMT